LGSREIQVTSATANRLSPSIVGRGEFTFTADPYWHALPVGIDMTEATSVATDSRDRVFVFNRSAKHPVLIFDRNGRYLRSWGAGVFARPHGVHIDGSDFVYCTDDLGHAVRKFTADGELLLTLNASGQPSDTGANSVDYRNIRRAAAPFNFPTNVAIGPAGEIYVSDGYGNARIHKFSPRGKLLSSFGAPGAGPGEFHVPHGIAVDRHGAVYVADRENSRIQIFDSGGNFLAEWLDVARPCQVFIDATDRVYVAELGYRAGMFPGNLAPHEHATGGRVSIFTASGDLLARWGGGAFPCEPGDFFAPHDIWVDSYGDLYVSEVTYTAGISKGAIGSDCHTLQKFTKRPMI
jgi:DNA-binding beta-propeller fold protein YncE